LIIKDVLVKMRVGIAGAVKCRSCGVYGTTDGISGAVNLGDGRFAETLLAPYGAVKCRSCGVYGTTDGIRGFREVLKVGMRGTTEVTAGAVKCRSSAPTVRS
jgi:hypothetical protein